MEYILPVPAHEVRETFVRGDKTYHAVIGINTAGYPFMHIEMDEVTELGFTVRWVPEDMPFKFKQGVCEPIEVYWEQELYIKNTFVQKTGERTVLTINHPDTVEFTPMLGIMFMRMMVNGFVRGVKGFDDQPVYNGAGDRIPDTVFLEDGVTVDTENSYDTSKAPVMTYYTHKVPVVQPEVTEEVQPEPQPEPEVQPEAQSEQEPPSEETPPTQPEAPTE